MELIRIVLEDLTILRDGWNDDISEARLRNEAVILRKLLCDKYLARAWQASGHKGAIRILAPDLKKVLSGVDRSKVIFAMCGGALYRDVEIALFTAIQDGEAVSEQGIEFNPYRDFTLHDFVDATTIVANGVSVSRSKLIKYFANKLGGAHFDDRRDPEDQVFAALDQTINSSTLPTIGDFDGKYMELLAMGQLLVNAPDISNWMLNPDS